MSQYYFPEHRISPKDKNAKWCLDYARAICWDAASHGHDMFINNKGDYERKRLYAANKQPIGKYQKLSEIDESTDETVMNVDFTPRGPYPKFRTIGIEKILENEYAPVATPVDLSSKDDNTSIYNRIKAKLTVREMFMQVDPELANNPSLMPEGFEPESLEELEMRMEHGEQFNRSKDMEQVIQLTFHKNRVGTHLRPQLAKDSWDFGVNVVKDCLNDEGEPIAKYVYPGHYITSWCRESDFSDAKYAGEIMIVPIMDLADKFDQSDLQTILSNANDSGNPFLTKGFLYPKRNRQGKYDECLVAELYWYSYDSHAWQVGESKYGNPVVKNTKVGSYDKPGKIVKTIKQVYTCKWIVGTDLVYDWGKAPNTKRRYSDYRKASNTTLPYTVTAYNFNDMVVEAYADRLVPFADDYMMVILKTQNVRNNLIPNGFSIDLDALETVAMTDGGKTLGKKDLLDLFRKKGLHLFRSSGLNDSKNPNAKPIDMVQNQISGEIVALYNELAAIVQQFREVVGFNEITDGSTPKERTLNGVASMAAAATNTALMPLIRADKQMMTALAENMFLRVQQTIRIKGSYSGFVPGLNETTMKFVQADAKIANKDFAIMLEMKANEEQRQLLLMLFQKELENENLELADAIMIMYTYNLKMAHMLLAYRAKKNKERKAAEKAAAEQRTFEGQQQSAIVSEQAKQQTLQVEYDLKLREQKYITERELMLLQMKLESQERIKSADTAVRALGAQQQPQALPAANEPLMLEAE